MILVNLFNFDYLIFHYRKAETGAGIDHSYLTRLSADSLSYKEELYLLTKDYQEKPSELEKQRATENGLWRIINKIERLQDKYNKLDIQGFSLLEYLQYKKIKTIDTDSYRNKYSFQN